MSLELVLKPRVLELVLLMKNLLWLSIMVFVFIAEMLLVNLKKTFLLNKKSVDKFLKQNLLAGFFCVYNKWRFVYVRCISQ